MLLMQAGGSAGWVGPTVAVSLVVIALAFALIAAAIFFAVRQAVLEMRELSALIRSLRGDLAPALGAIEAVSSEGQRLAGMVSGEAEELVNASRRLRAGLGDRLANLEALYDVVEEEVEETALDLAVTLRRLRMGTGWFVRLRRLLVGRRRR